MDGLKQQMYSGSLGSEQLDKNMPEFKSRTAVCVDDTEKGVIHVYIERGFFDDRLGGAQRITLNLNEKAISCALVEVGWTPPSE